MPVLHLKLDLTKELYDRAMAMTEQQRELCVIDALRSATAPPVRAAHTNMAGGLTPSEPGGTVPENTMAPKPR